MYTFWLLLSFFSFVNEANRACPRTGLCLFHLLHLLGHQKTVHSFARILSAHCVSTGWAAAKRITVCTFLLYIMS